MRSHRFSIARFRIRAGAPAPASALALALAALLTAGGTNAVVNANAAVTSNAASPDSVRFFRIIDGPRPSAHQQEIDRFQYGAEVLYTGDVHGPHAQRVDGIVWQADFSQRRYFVGRENPVTDAGPALARIADDKWQEAKLLQKYAPDSFPRTENIADLLAEHPRDGIRGDPERFLTDLFHDLSERYPQGFFLKPIASFNTDGAFPNDRTPFSELYRNYRDHLRASIQARFRETQDPVGVHYEFKKKPFYAGHILDDLLAHPERMIVQERLRPRFTSPGKIEEYRVHVIQGRVLRGGSEHRWDDLRHVTRQSISEAERFAQRMTDRLPEPFRKMCLGVDVMRTENGAFKVIELNAGGQSGYLYPDTDLYVTHLLAAHFTKQPTPLLREMDAIARARDLNQKQALYQKLLDHPELKDLVSDPEPMSEIHRHVKEAFMAELGPETSALAHQNALQVASALRAFKLQRYLTAQEIELLSSRLSGHAGMRETSRPEIGELLGLSERDHLFFENNGETPLLELTYDDDAVEALLSRWVRERLKQAGPDAAAPEYARALAEDAVSRHVVTRAQVDAEPFQLELIARDAELAFPQGLKLLFTGSQRALLRSILRSLR